MKAFSRKEVILCAGVVMSPVILMQSGIGPRRELEKHKIPVKSDLPGVGKNLIDHIHTTFWMKFSPKNSIIRSPAAELDNTFNLAVHPDVFASQIEGILIGFMNSVNDSIYPDFQLTHGVHPPNDPNLKLLLTDTISNYKNKLLEVNENYLVSFVNIVLLQPKSRGFIRLNGTLPCNKPIIRPRYFSDEKDMDKMLRAVKFQLSYFETNAYRENDGEFIWIPIEECDRFPFR